MSVLVKDYEIHPAADLFPMMKGAKFAAFVEDIRQFKQRESIKLLGGKIIDGRNRYAACKEAGVTPWFESLPEDTDPNEYVVSINIRRRQLTVAQRALVGARIAQVLIQEGRSRSLQNIQEKQGSAPTGRIRPVEGLDKRSTEVAAEKVGVGKSSIKQALEVLASSKSKELVELIEDGKTLNHVYSKLPKPKKEKKRPNPERESGKGQNTDEKASGKPQDEREQDEAPYAEKAGKTHGTDDIESARRNPPKWPAEGYDKAADTARKTIAERVRLIRFQLQNLKPYVEAEALFDEWLTVLEDFVR